MDRGIFSENSHLRVAGRFLAGRIDLSSRARSAIAKPGITPGLNCYVETGPTRFELATSGVTGRRSNQLNYDPVDNW